MELFGWLYVILLILSIIFLVNLLFKLSSVCTDEEELKEDDEQIMLLTCVSTCLFS